MSKSKRLSQFSEMISNRPKIFGLKNNQTALAKVVALLCSSLNSLNLPISSKKFTAMQLNSSTSTK